MKLKSFYVVLMVVLFIAAPLLANAQTVSAARETDKEYREGGLYLTPQIALYAYALNFGASLEYGLNENIGVGGTIMFASWGDDIWGNRLSQTLITPSVEAYYHFIKLDVDKLDLFAGASLGFSIYSFKWDVPGMEGGDVGTSNLFLSPVVGGRYYFSEKIAASLKLYISILGNWAGVGGVAGITVVLK
jgi:hypothetical protein